MSLSPSPLGHRTLPAALPVPASVATHVDDDSPSSLSGSASNLYAHHSSMHNILVAPLIPDAAAYPNGLRAADDVDASHHNDDSRVTVAPHSCMSLPSTRTAPRGTAGPVAHNPYSCSPSFLEVPVDNMVEDADLAGAAAAGPATSNVLAAAAAAAENSAVSRSQSMLPAPEYSLLGTNNNSNNNLSVASTLRVHVKQRMPRHSSASTLVHAASPMNLSLDPSQLRTPDPAPLTPPTMGLQPYAPHPHQAVAAMRKPSRSSVMQHTPYADAALSPAYEVGGKPFMNEDCGVYASEEGTEDYSLTPRDTAYEQQTDTSCLPSPSAVPLTPEFVALVSQSHHHHDAAAAADPMNATVAGITATRRPTVMSSAASEAPTSMSICSGKRPRRRHGRKGRHSKDSGAAWADLAPEMDLMFLPPPPPPLQHLASLRLPLRSSAVEDSEADVAYTQYRGMVQRWYDRTVLSELSYLVAAYGGTGEVSRPCPRREQFVRDHGPGASGAAAVSALVAWVASMDQWWMECVQPFSFTRRHQALPPAMTAAALAAASHSGGSSTSRANSLQHGNSGASRRVSAGANAALTPLMISSGTSSATPGSPVQWMTPQSPAASVFSYSLSSPPPALSSPTCAPAMSSDGYPVYPSSNAATNASYYYGYANGMAATAYPQQQYQTQYKPPSPQQHYQQQQPQQQQPQQQSGYRLPSPSMAPRSQGMYPERLPLRPQGSQWSTAQSPYAQQAVLY